MMTIRCSTRGSPARQKSTIASPNRFSKDWGDEVNYQKQGSLMADNHLPADAAWLFPEYDFDTMHLECHKSVIIERVLERGTWEQLRWLFVTYGEASVAKWVWRHGFRLLSRRSFALWRLALGVTDYVAPEWAVEAKGMEPW